MFIIYSSGTRVSTAYEGRVADFCPVCLAIRPFAAYSVFSYRHLYSLRISRRDYLALDLRCETCGAGVEEPWNAARGIVRNRRATLESLLAAAPPDLRTDLQSNETQLKQARSLPSGSADRLTMLADALIAIERKGHRRHRGLHFDGLTVLMIVACVGGSLGGLLAMRGATSASMRFQDQYGAYIGVYFLGTIGLTLIAAMTDRRRYFRRELEPMICRVVASLGVSRAELDALRSEMLPLRLHVVRLISPARIDSLAERLIRGASLR